jgi:hypothetical protein
MISGIGILFYDHVFLTRIEAQRTIAQLIDICSNSKLFSFEIVLMVQFARIEDNGKATWNNTFDKFPEIDKSIPLKPLYINIWNRMRGNPESWPLESRPEIPESLKVKLLNANVDEEANRLFAGKTIF